MCSIGAVVGSREQLKFAVQAAPGQPLQPVNQILGIADHAPFGHMALARVIHGGIRRGLFGAASGDQQARGDRLVRELPFERFERAFDVALVPPDRRTGGHIALKCLRLGEQSVEGEQAAVGMAEQGLPSGVDRVALGDQRFEFVLDKGQKVIGTARWRRFAARQALAILGFGRVILGTRLEVVQGLAGVADADHQYRIAKIRVGPILQGLGLDRQPRKQGVAIQHIEHRIATRRRRVSRFRDEDAVFLASALRMQVTLAAVRQSNWLPAGFFPSVCLYGGKPQTGEHGEHGEHGEQGAFHGSTCLRRGGSGPSNQFTFSASSPEKRWRWSSMTKRRRFSASPASAWQSISSRSSSASIRHWPKANSTCA